MPHLSSSDNPRYLLSSLPEHFYLCVAFKRMLYCYDFLTKQPLFDLIVSNVTEMLFVDSEKILAIREGDQIMLYSMEAQIRQYKERGRKMMRQH